MNEPLQAKTYTTEVVCNDTAAEDLPIGAQFTITRELAERIVRLGHILLKDDVKGVILSCDPGSVRFNDWEPDSVIEDLPIEDDFPIENERLHIRSKHFWLSGTTEIASHDLCSSPMLINDLANDFGISVPEHLLFPRLVIHMEGGLIQDLQADQPLNILVVDRDTEGVDEDELMEIAGEDAYASDRSVSKNEVDVEHVDQVFEEFHEQMPLDD